MCISSFVLVLILTLPGRVLSRREGAMAFASIISAGYVLFCLQKENQKSASDFDALDPRERVCSPLSDPKEVGCTQKS